MLGAEDLRNMLEAIGGKEYDVLLDAVKVGTIFGVFKRAAEFMSVGDAEELIVKPALKCITTEVEQFGMNHRIDIDGTEYRFWKSPVEKGNGFSMAGLIK